MTKKLLAMGLALLLALSALSALAQAAAPAASPEEKKEEKAPTPEQGDKKSAEAAPLQDDTQMASVGADAILLKDVRQLLPRMLAGKHLEDESDIRKVVTVLVRQKVIEKKIAELGLDKFSDEEQKAFKTEAEAEWNKALDIYVSQHLSEDKPEAREKLRKEAVSFFEKQGDSLEGVIDGKRKVAAVDKLRSQLAGEYKPTDKEIEEVFNKVGASYKAEYENNIMAYEYMSQHYNQKPWYTPAGYRGILHILIKADAELLSKHTELQARLEENKGAKETVATESGKAKKEEPVTQEMIDAAKKAILDSKKDIVKAITDRLAKGEAFEKLIAEYNEDPGMKDERILKEGYPVHEKSIVWAPAFTKAAFSEKMKKPGDISDPVVSNHGIHILKYLRDIPSGLNMTDAIKTQISEYLVNARENKIFAQNFETWEKAAAVKYEDANIEKATMEAAKAKPPAGTVQGGPLQAAPESPEQKPIDGAKPAEDVKTVEQPKPANP